MFKRRPAPEPYKPIHEYEVNIERSLHECYIVDIWPKGKRDEPGARIYHQIFVGDTYGRNGLQQAKNAVLPFIEKHEKEGLVVDYDKQHYIVRATHVCQPEAE